MGNLLSCTVIPRSLARDDNDDVVKLVHSNGLVEEFYRAVRVAELSVDYPHHFICNSGDLRHVCSGNPPKLSEEESMELGQIYFLLPERPLTQTDVAALFSKAGVARKASYKDLFVSTQQQVTPDLAALEEGEDVEQDSKLKQPDVKFSRELIHKLIEETRLKLETQMKQKSGTVVTSNTPSARRGQLSLPELQTAYAHHMLVRSCTKLWRPPLETIKEDHFNVS